MKNPYDKNGNLLKGFTVWTRTISEDGGLQAHDAKVATEIFAAFAKEHPCVGKALADEQAQQQRAMLKLVK